MREETLRWPGGWVRLGSWRGHADIAYLSVGAQRPPTEQLVRRWLATLRGEGYRAVLTSPLAPAEVLPFVDAGFAVRERLHLLTHDLRHLPPATGPTRRVRRSDHDAVLAIDAASFDEPWRLGDGGLGQVLGATPSVRFRAAGSWPLVGYAVTGRAGRQGYVQRLAVHPHARRRGSGQALVADGLRWLRRHGAKSALVNTQLANTAALALYQACGFRSLRAGLSVLGRPL